MNERVFFISFEEERDSIAYIESVLNASTYGTRYSICYILPEIIRLVYWNPSFLLRRYEKSGKGRKL